VGVNLGRSETAGRVDTSGVLDIFAVFSNQSRSNLLKLLPQLGYELGADKILDRLLGSRLGENVNVELSRY
jgi:hypothetical protein